MQPLVRSGLLLALLGFSAASAADWPQFLGPTRNAVYPGADLAAAWPKDGPPVGWQRKDRKSTRLNSSH